MPESACFNCRWPPGSLGLQLSGSPDSVPSAGSEVASGPEGSGSSEPGPTGRDTWSRECESPRGRSEERREEGMRGKGAGEEGGVEEGHVPRADSGAQTRGYLPPCPRV